MNMAELVAGVRDAATNGDKHESPKSKPVITMTLNEQLALHKQQHGALQERLRHLNNSLKNFDQRAARAKIE